VEELLVKLVLVEVTVVVLVVVVVVLLTQRGAEPSMSPSAV